jgi:hypothetical protein
VLSNRQTIAFENPVPVLDKVTLGSAVAADVGRAAPLVGEFLQHVHGGKGDARREAMNALHDIAVLHNL